MSGAALFLVHVNTQAERYNVDDQGISPSRPPAEDTRKGGCGFTAGLLGVKPRQEDCKSSGRRGPDLSPSIYGNANGDLGTLVTSFLFRQKGIPPAARGQVRVVKLLGPDRSPARLRRACFDARWAVPTTAPAPRALRRAAPSCCDITPGRHRVGSGRDRSRQPGRACAASDILEVFSDPAACIASPYRCARWPSRSVSCSEAIGFRQVGQSGAYAPPSGDASPPGAPGMAVEFLHEPDRHQGSSVSWRRHRSTTWRSPSTPWTSRWPQGVQGAGLHRHLGIGEPQLLPLRCISRCRRRGCSRRPPPTSASPSTKNPATSARNSVAALAGRPARTSCSARPGTHLRLTDFTLFDPTPLPLSLCRNPKY